VLLAFLGAVVAGAILGGALGRVAADPGHPRTVPGPAHPPPPDAAFGPRLRAALPAETLELCRAADAVLLGAVGGPRWGDPDARQRP